MKKATIWKELEKKLGRPPTPKEVKAEVRRIIAEAVAPRHMICVYTLAANHREFRRELEERFNALGVQGTYSCGRYLVGGLCFHFVGEVRHIQGARGYWLLLPGAGRAPNYGELQKWVDNYERSGDLKPMGSHLMALPIP